MNRQRLGFMLRASLHGVLLYFFHWYGGQRAMWGYIAGALACALHLWLSYQDRVEELPVLPPILHKRYRGEGQWECAECGLPVPYEFQCSKCVPGAPRKGPCWPQS